jgi:hypothetical protein
VETNLLVKKIQSKINILDQNCILDELFNESKLEWDEAMVKIDCFR